MRIVFDTNVYISALITSGGRGENAYLAAVAGRFSLFVSIPILTETAGKLRAKFHWDDAHITRAVRHVAAVAAVLKPQRRIALLTDDPDNRILECAMEAGADYIVTGDRHLLSLGAYEGCRIVTLAEFLDGVLGE
ncbi:MAG: putative toxin-antitoxin system toxin component, PIN family [Geobacter sp.]|nr:putative toxin-antitoxin system toxin component, PIN family [Geobacter sp.]